MPSISYMGCGYREDAVNKPVLGLNHHLDQAGVPCNHIQNFAPLRFAGRVLGKLGVLRNFVHLPGRGYIVAMAWPNDGRVFPVGFYREMIPWMCDCWPHDYAKWESIFRRNRIRTAFISSRGSTEYFSRKIPEMTSIWMPEACEPTDYYPDAPLSKRSIHVLEIGRKHAPFHDAVRQPLKDAGYRHVFSQNGTKTLLFPDYELMHRALGDSVLSMCFPKTTTHPELAGGLETATLRYFESIASGCLVLGQCPAELEELFGYNPVIEVDFADPWGQVKSILSSLPDYQAMADRNRKRLMEVGTWQVRAASILNILRERGWTYAGNGAPSAVAQVPAASR